MKYQLWVDDNFHYQDEDERYLAGEYATAEEAIAVAKRMVDAFLKKEHRPGMTAEQLYDRYTDFGSDPFLRSDDPRRSREVQADLFSLAPRVLPSGSHS